MENKMENLLIRGFTILADLRESFKKEWKELLSNSNFQNTSLVNGFDAMIDFAFQQISTEELPSVDSFILSLLAEWQNCFSALHDEYESIFLVTSIETAFHKLLTTASKASLLDHQAIQAFFSRILDHSLLTRDWEDRIEKWIKKIMETNILPMKWLAVVKKDQSDYKIEKIVCSSFTEMDKHLLEMCSNLKANQIDHLSMALSRLLEGNLDQKSILQISCLNDILLICLENDDVLVTGQQTEFIRSMYLRQLKLLHLENKMEWKDASLLFLQRLLGARSAESAVKAITQGIVDYMPFKRCALFLYNHFEDKGIGVAGYNVSNSAIQQIKEAIFKLPIISKYLSSLTHSHPLYFANAAEVLPEKYIKEFQLQSLVVLPIFVPAENKLLGIALLDQGGNSQFSISAQSLATLIKFGHYAGDLLYSIWDETLQQFSSSNCVLTKREKEVLKQISEGASINEAAEALHLSSYTVRDYVSIIIQKLSAKNRTDAAVKALKMKLIS